MFASVPNEDEKKFLITPFLCDLVAFAVKSMSYPACDDADAGDVVGGVTETEVLYKSSAFILHP